MTRGPKLGAKPIKYTDELCEQVGKLYPSLGQTLTAEALGLTRHQVKNIAARIGAKCDHGPQPPSAEAARTAALLKADREKREAAARANAAKAAAARPGGPVPMERKPLRHGQAARYRWSESRCGTKPGPPSHRPRPPSTPAAHASPWRRRSSISDSNPTPATLASSLAWALAGTTLKKFDPQLEHP